MPNIDENITHVAPKDEIRELIGKLTWAINRQSQRHLMPYDWNEYGHPELVRLLDKAKIDFDGSLKYKDKRGSWRVMKDKTGRKE